MRSSVRELYERENQTLREARELALAEKEEATSAAQRLVDKVALLQEEAKTARVDADSKTSDAVNQLRLKTFELESLQALYEQVFKEEESCRCMKMPTQDRHFDD